MTSVYPAQLPPQDGARSKRVLFQFTAWVGRAVRSHRKWDFSTLKGKGGVTVIRPLFVEATRLLPPDKPCAANPNRGFGPEHRSS